MADLIDRDLTIHELEAFKESRSANLLRMSFDDVIDVVNGISAVDRWISVKDALPEENKYVFALVKRKHSSRVILSVMIEGKWKIGVNDCSDGFDVVGVITHWMPMPEPPEGGAEDG